MSRALSKVGKQAPIYLAGVVANRLAGFLMLPIYTRYLTTSDYGVLELLVLTVDIIGTIGAVGLSSGVFKFHAEPDDPREQNAVLSTATLGVAGLSLLVCVVGFVFAGALSVLVLGDDGQPLYFKMFFAIYFFQQLEIIPLLLLRIKDQAVPFVAIGLLKLVTMLSMNIWLVVFRDMRIVGVLTSNLVASGIVGLGLSVYLFRSVGMRFARPLFRRMVKFGLPMMLWFLGNSVLVFSDRYFLKHFSGAADVGIYSLAYRFVFLLPALAAGPFMTVWQPQRFVLAKQQDSGETFTRAFTYFNLALGSVAILLALFTQDVVRIMADQSFHTAFYVVPILLAAQIMYQWVPFSNLGLLIEEKTSVLAWIALVSAIVVLALNILLVPQFGMMGAAVATLLAYFLRFVLVLVASQREFYIHHEWQRVLALYGIIAVAVAVKFAFSSLPIFPSLTLGSALLLISSGVVYRGLLQDDERTAAHGYLRRIVRKMPWSSSA